MGRAPCCDKANVKKGPWSPEEDAKLKSYIEQHGTGGNWIALPHKIGLKRCGKSCRLRWLNYLRPNIKHGGFSEEEDNIICSLYVSIGSRWSIIAAQLPGRTDNDIKNYWNTRLKKKLLGKQRKHQAAQARRANTLKQEPKRDPNNDFVVMNMNQSTPCLSTDQPSSRASIQQPFDLNNLRDLLTKLEGYPYDDLTNSLPQHHHHQQLSSVSASLDVMDNSSAMSSYMFEGFQVQDFHHNGMSEMAQQVDGLMQANYYGMMESMDMSHVTNSSSTATTTSTTETTSWGDMTSLLYSPNLVSEFQGMPHQDDVAFHESRYYGCSTNSLHMGVL